MVYADRRRWYSNAPGGCQYLGYGFGTLLLVLVLEATRRTNGLLMSLIGLFFIVYIFFGRYFPGILAI